MSATAAAQVRLFVALELPEPALAALIEWRAPLLCEQPALRPVAPQALHVTLCFLGWREEAASAPIAALVEDCARGHGGAAGLALGEPLWLPRRRPRALAVCVEDRHGQLAALQAKLSRRLAADGWYEPEGRPYLPHATLARVRASQAVPRRVGLPPVPALAFAGAAVVLYRSHLERAGARYEPLSVSRLA